MASSKAATAKAYLAELPPERRAVIAAVRDVILAHLPPGYEEQMRWGMLSYEIPLSRYPVTYNGQPLSYATLAAQKNAYSIYLMGVYQDPALLEELRAGFEKNGKKLDMGKSCVRFTKLEDVPLDLIGAIVGATTVEQYLAHYEANRKQA